MQKKTGVLLVNLGTPDNPYPPAVRKYLNQFLTDPRVLDIPWLNRQLLVRLLISPFRSRSSGKTYEQIWNKETGSPLLFHSKNLLSGVQALIEKHNTPNHKFVVELAMRYQEPSMEAALERLKKEHLHELIVIPLFQQYASASSGSVMEHTMKIISDWLYIPELKIISSFHLRPEMIEVFAANARKYNLAEYDHFLFSFHGLPQRQLIKTNINNHCYSTPDCCKNLCEKNHSCYGAQSYETAKAIANKLDIPDSKYSVSFQSRLGKDPWTQPYTVKKLPELAGKGIKKVLVFCPAFTADCLETVFEMTIENAEVFLHAGGEKLDLVESLNSHPLWCEGVKKMILEYSSIFNTVTQN